MNGSDSCHETVGPVWILTLYDLSLIYFVNQHVLVTWYSVVPVYSH